MVCEGQKSRKVFYWVSAHLGGSTCRLIFTPKFQVLLGLHGEAAGLEAKHVLVNGDSATVTRRS